MGPWGAGSSGSGMHAINAHDGDLTLQRSSLRRVPRPAVPAVWLIIMRAMHMPRADISLHRSIDPSSTTWPPSALVPLSTYVQYYVRMRETLDRPDEPRTNRARASMHARAPPATAALDPRPACTSVTSRMPLALYYN